MVVMTDGREDINIFDRSSFIDSWTILRQ